MVFTFRLIENFVTNILYNFELHTSGFKTWNKNQYNMKRGCIVLYDIWKRTALNSSFRQWNIIYRYNWKLPKFKDNKWFRRFNTNIDNVQYITTCYIFRLSLTKTEKMNKNWNAYCARTAVSLLIKNRQIIKLIMNKFSYQFQHRNPVCRLLMQ